MCEGGTVGCPLSCIAKLWLGCKLSKSADVKIYPFQRFFYNAGLTKPLSVCCVGCQYVAKMLQSLSGCNIFRSVEVTGSPAGMLASEVVVVHLYGEDYGRAHCGDGVGYHQRPVGKHQSLYDKEDASGPEEQECGQGYAVCVAGTDGVERLREISAYHAYGGRIADDVYPDVVHFGSVSFEGWVIEQAVPGETPQRR